MMKNEPYFDPRRLERLAEIERWHFWFKGRQALVRQLLRRYMPVGSRILDVGCGTGWGMESVAFMGFTVAGVDARPEGLKAFKHRSRVADLMQADAGHLPLCESAFRGALLLDVLEHVEDAAVLGDLYRVLAAGSIVIISVPAIPWLWSCRDEAAGHRRRYTAQTLHDVCTKAGFTALERRYFQSWLLPSVILSRLVGRRMHGLRDMEDLPGPIVNSLLTWITQLEVGLGRYIPWPWGTSILMVCRR